MRSWRGDVWKVTKLDEGLDIAREGYATNRNSSSD
jgi:hypothetical protein